MRAASKSRDPYLPARRDLSSGSAVADVPGPRQVDVFEWIEGRQLGSVSEGLTSDPAWIEQTYGIVGELMARMHNQSCLGTAGRVPTPLLV